jgi:hypothetical protein
MSRGRRRFPAGQRRLYSTQRCKGREVAKEKEKVLDGEAPAERLRSGVTDGTGIQN